VLQERNNPLFSMGANLMQPIFFGGLLQAQVDIRTAEQQAAVAEVGKVSQKAFGEVESALSAGFTASERELILQRSEAQNARALELSRVRFRVGSGDLRAVQQQQLALYTIQVSRLRMQAERLIQRVNLHLALGGGFEDVPGGTTKTSSTGVTAP
jgi:outer membrane protein TolC